MKFGEKLREIRKARGFSKREDFCKVVDMAYSSMASLEQDKRPPETIEIKTVIKISETLQWDIKDIAKTIRPYIKWRNK